jgi:hypothetical protein
VDRRIAREPAYESKAPRYGLVVFGPDAQARVWLVHDGDWLYVDANGNGDLTEPGKRFRLEPPRGFPVQYGSSPAVLITVNGRNWGKLELSAFRPHPEFQPQDADEEKTLDRYRSIDGGTQYRLVVSDLTPSPREPGAPFAAMIKQVASQDARGYLAFAARPQDAPVVHFDGPFTLDGSPRDFRLERTTEPYDFAILVGTHGLGKGSFACLCYDHYAETGEGTRVIPEDVYPEADVELPAQTPEAAPVRVKWVLRQRC